MLSDSIIYDLTSKFSDGSKGSKTIKHDHAHTWAFYLHIYNFETTCLIKFTWVGILILGEKRGTKSLKITSCSFDTNYKC